MWLPWCRKGRPASLMKKKKQDMVVVMGWMAKEERQRWLEAP
jgi:hypothetical protein